jgi:hypothetical protein
LDELRELVRGELTDNARETLKALIVIEVHARDVVINLIEEKVQNVNDFEWISQVNRLSQFQSMKLFLLSFSYDIIGLMIIYIFVLSMLNFDMVTNI